MARKAAAQTQPEASLPETLIPLSEVPEHQRSAYEIELIDNPEEFRKVLSTEDFFSLIQNFPTAWWGERLSMYLYRHEDDGGLMVKNADGEGKYIKPVIRQPIDRDWVANRNGGGKFQLWLNLSEPGTRKQTTVRKYTFRLDGAPLVKDGQTVELNGKPVLIGAAHQAPPAEDRTDIAKVIDASSKANESAMGILAHASETAIDMVKAQSATASAPAKDPMEMAIKLVEVFRPAVAVTPAADPMTTALALMEKFESIIAKRNPAPEPERPETPLNETLDLVERLSGGKSLPELLKPASRSGDGEYGWVPPLASAFQTFVQNLPGIIAQANAARAQEFDRQVYLRSIQPGQPLPAVPPQLTALPAAPPAPNPQPSNITMPPPTSLNPDQIAGAIVDTICRGFDKDPRSGFECAAAIAFNFADQIEGLGIDKVLANPEEVKKFVAGMPPLAERSKDARWSGFEEDFLSYTSDRWGEPEVDGGEKKPPQPAA